MKALLASALTALVLVTTAWASNVTPAQLNALTKRVTKLEQRDAALARSLAAAQTASGDLSTRVAGAEARLTTAESFATRCLAVFEPVVVYDITPSDGTPAFSAWSPPDPSASAAFYVPATHDQSCFHAQ